MSLFQLCACTKAVCFCSFENGSTEEKSYKGRKNTNTHGGGGLETLSHNQGGVLFPLQEQRQHIPLKLNTLQHKLQKHLK